MQTESLKEIRIYFCFAKKKYCRLYTINDHKILFALKTIGGGFVGFEMDFDLLSCKNLKILLDKYENKLVTIAGKFLSTIGREIMEKDLSFSHQNLDFIVDNKN